MQTKEDLLETLSEEEISFTKERLDKIKKDEKLQLVTTGSSKDLVNFSVHKAFDKAIVQACKYKFGAV